MEKTFQAFFYSWRIYWIVPSWLESPVSPDKTFSIDPGMAFGTGTHATTQLCALQIYKLFKSSPAESALDVGTGTGILALLCTRLGVKTIAGIDNDPEAVRTARQNQVLNQSNFPTSIAFSEQSLDELTEKFDVVIANIIDGVLVRLFLDLLMKVKMPGFLVLSGILIEREDQFIDDILKIAQTQEMILETVLRLEKDEWVSLCFRVVSTREATQDES